MVVNLLVSWTRLFIVEPGRLTGTASPEILLAPAWCSKKWLVLNRIEYALRERRLARNAALQQTNSEVN